MNETPSTTVDTAYTKAPFSPTDTGLIQIAPHVWQKQGSAEGPSITVMGGTHGNETVGVEVAKQLLLYAMMNKVKAGALTIAFSNIEAIKAGTRKVKHDMNRAFSLPPWKPGDPTEIKRAQELQPVLAQTDVLLDLHSTLLPSAPFICVPELDHPHANFLPHLGIPLVLTGEGLLPPDKKPIYADTYVCAHGGMGVTIETGWQGDSSKIGTTRQSILNFLKAMGTFGEKLKTPPLFEHDECDEEAAAGSTALATSDMSYYDAYWNVIAGKQFAFTQPWKNFQQLEPGTHFATSDGLPLCVDAPSMIVFPKPPEHIVPGNEACLIAKKIGPH